MWRLNFAVKSMFSATKTVELIRKAYGDAALSRTTTIEWHKRFRVGRESVKDDERSGRPTTSLTDDNIAAVDKMVKEDRKVSSPLIADTLGIPKSGILRILKEDLKKRKLLKICPARTDTRANARASYRVPRPVKHD